MIMLSSLGLKGVLEKSRAQLGELEIHFDATQAILANLGSVRADLLVLTAEAMDDLKKKGLIAETRALGSSGVGVAVRAGAPRPDIGTVEAFKAALERAQSVAHSKVGASGIYFSELIDQLQLKLKKRVIVEKGPVGLVVARGEAEVGVQQLCELEPVPGHRHRRAAARADPAAHALRRRGPGQCAGPGRRGRADEAPAAARYLGSAFTSSPHFLSRRLRSADEPYFAES
jgi:molybdate transport system substrate-binding protein